MNDAIREGTPFFDKIAALFGADTGFFILCIAAAVLVFFGLGVLVGKTVEKLKSGGRIKRERSDALKKSKAVLRGQIYEQLAPFFPNFPVNPKSLKFLGSPVDYVAFVGNGKNAEEIEEIVFIEIKTGGSKLTASEKAIKNAIEKKRVRFVEYYF